MLTEEGDHSMRFTEVAIRPMWNSIFLVVVILVGIRCDVTREAEVYLIPKGFVGWVRLEYGIPNAPPLPVQGGVRIIRVPENGHLQTSTKFEEGWALDRFFYIDSSGQREELMIEDLTKGRRGQIWHIVNGSDQVNQIVGPTFKEFFVGKEEEFRMSWEATGGEPQPGPIATTTTGFVE